MGWLLCLAPAPAVADTTERLKDFRHTVWRAKDGLPSDSLTAIEQTADGFLWIATYGGVYRFDGERFERLPLPRDPKLKSASAFSLCASQNGGLWIGFTFGGIGLFKDGKLKMYDADDGLPQGSVRSIAEGAAGDEVWVATSSGVAFFDGTGRWHAVDVGDAVPGAIYGLTFDAGNSLWAIGRDRIYRRLPGPPVFEPYPLKLRRAAEVIPATDGSVWVIDEGRLQRVAPRGPPVVPLKTHNSSGFVDRRGFLWATGSTDLVRLPPGRAGEIIDFAGITDRFGPADGLAWGGSNSRLLETRDGQIWLLSNSALERFSPRTVAPLDTSFMVATEAQELGIGALPDGGLWVMPREGALRSVKTGQASIVPGLTDISAIAQVADGTTWAGGPREFWHFDAGTWAAVPRPPGTEGFDAQAFAGKSGEDVWVSIVRKGVFHRVANAWLAYGDLPQLPHQPAVTMAFDAHEDLWLGYIDGRIARVHGPMVQMLGAADGLDVGVVTALIAAHGSGAVWAGGEYGLRRWDGHAFAPLHAERERVFDLVTGIVQTAAGDLWVNSTAGIVRVPAAEIERSIGAKQAIVVDVFDHLDGYEGSSARVRPLPTALQGADGKLWFASSAGIFSIVPQPSFQSRAPPLASIERLIANGTQADLRSPIVLEKGTSAVQIDFIGLDLVTPERVRYRYRLEGVDADWRDVGRQRQAFYTNIGAGDYRFRVVASSDGRAWSPQEAALSFRIAPTFTQTAWFLALCALALIAAVAMLFRWRVRQVAQRLRWKLDAQLTERDRIARELHDTLLQSTQGLILRFQAISNRMPAGDANRQKIETALERADEVLSEGRDRVRGLRHSAKHHASFIEGLRALGDELAGEFHIAFRCECIGDEPRLSPELGDELQRIVAEALVNACRHSQAGSIELRIAYRPGELSVIVDDDGIGVGAEVSEASSRPGHWGLRGMRERSERIGARLAIGPRKEGGTRVELVVATRRGGVVR